MVVRLLAIAEKRYQSLECPAYLATGQLLDCAGHVATLNLAQRFGQSVEPDQLHFAEEVARFQSLERAKRHVVVCGDNDVWWLRHTREGGLSHSEALRSIEPGRVLKDDFVFVLGLIQDIVQSLIAVDSRARTRLTLKVHDSGAVRKQLFDKLALRFAALNVVGADMRENARDLVDAAVYGNDGNLCIDRFLNRGCQSVDIVRSQILYKN